MTQDDIHVYPIDDLKEHVLDGENCWCGPRRNDEQPLVVVHNSLDRREVFESLPEQ